MRHRSSRSGQDTNGESLTSKAIIQLEKTRDTVEREHQNERPSLSVACLVSTSSVSRQILEILSKLKCHEIHEGKREEKQRLKYRRKAALCKI